jgi:hypothetical protein
MTRSNLNFIWQNRGEAPRTLFHYHNGDQYPEGLLVFYGIEEFLSIRRPWTPDDFRAWIRKNYRESRRRVTQLANGMLLESHCDTDVPAEAEDLGEGGQPRIYFTEGFLTDYSYVFQVSGWRSRTPNQVTVWDWDRRIFHGSARRFLSFCRKRAQKRSLTRLAHSEHSLRGVVAQNLASGALDA